MKKDESESVWGDHGDDRHNFLTILYNFLTIGKSAWAKKELAGLTLTQETSEKELEGVARNFTAANFAEARRRRYDHCEKPVKMWSYW